jgi:hypothetical protein
MLYYGVAFMFFGFCTLSHFSAIHHVKSMSRGSGDIFDVDT